MTTVARKPAYHRIADLVRDLIATGRLDPHEAIPSERRLSEEHGVSRMTARQAIALLEREGWVYRRSKSGTFVSEPRIPLRVGSFSDEIVRRGRRPGARVLSAALERPPAVVAGALGVDPADSVYALVRLRSADGEPLAIETTYLPGDVCSGLLGERLDGSLWALLRELAGLVPTRAEAAIEAVALDSLAARRLGAAREAPGIMLTRRTFDSEGRCFEFARDLYRGDRAELRVEASIAEEAPCPDPAMLMGVRAWGSG